VISKSASMMAGIAALLAAMPAAGAETAGPLGMWMNPHQTVAVRTGACGDRLCGWIVWASAEAQADARDGGVGSLIGTELLENYRHDPSGWSGTVYVPDMGRRFYSRIEQVGADRLRVKGCILHGLVCRSQLWRRIAELPRG
jgi:uncharacterized protein (DUF2147 family)